jgi:hypothetical protein
MKVFNASDYANGLGSECIEYVEKNLTLEQLFRLVEIADRTSHSAIRDAALGVIERAFYPLTYLRGETQ